MICVECGESVSSLYKKYKNGYIKLTDCPNCNKTADKYIEFDNVLLFIDILLLKSQAYKHLVFNLLGDSEADKALLRYNVRRIRVISVLSEIYLTWAYEEKTMYDSSMLTPYLIYNAIMKTGILSQYFYFAVKAFVDDIITHTVVHLFFLNLLNWRPSSWKSKPFSGPEYRYLKNSLSLTVILSEGTKIFPILMLIWPYDNTNTTIIIRSISTINLIESLRIITGRSATLNIIVFLMIEILKFVLTKAILIFMLAKGDLITMQKFSINEYQAFLGTMKDITRYITGNN